MAKYLILFILFISAIICTSANAAKTHTAPQSLSSSPGIAITPYPALLAGATPFVAGPVNTIATEQVALPKYTAEILVPNESTAERDKAIVAALEQVLIKNSGKQDIAKNKKIKKALTSAATIVQSYSYVNNSANSGNSQTTLFLQVNFYPNSVDKILSLVPKTQTSTSNSDNSTLKPHDDTNANNEKSSETSTNGDNDLVTPDADDGAASTPEIVNMRISNITKLSQHDSVITYLKTLSRDISDIELTNVSSDYIELKIKIDGGQDALIKLIKSKGPKLSPTDSGLDIEDEATPLDYRWNE